MTTPKENLVNGFYSTFDETRGNGACRVGASQSGYFGEVILYVVRSVTLCVQCLRVLRYLGRGRVTENVP